MRSRMLLPMAILVLLVCSPQLMPAQTHIYRPQVGQRHVDFVLPTIDTRKPVSLSDYRGKKVLLIQFASW